MHCVTMEFAHVLADTLVIRTKAVDLNVFKTLIAMSTKLALITSVSNLVLEFVDDMPNVLLLIIFPRAAV